jgi:hypothetical protein
MISIATVGTRHSIYIPHPEEGEGVVIDLEIEGVRTRVEHDCKADAYNQVEIALRDINGDRKPEIWLVLGAPWGTLCVFEYKGLPDMAARRRGNAGTTYIGSTAPFRKLLQSPAGWTVAVANDESIRVCGGTECLSEWRYKFDGTRFQQTMDSGQRVKGANARPFRDEEERSRQAPPSKPSGPRSLEDRVIALVKLYHTASSEEDLTELFNASVITFGNRTVGVRDLVRGKLEYYSKLDDWKFDLVPGTLRVISSGLSVYEVEFEFTYRVVMKTDHKLRTGRGTKRLKLIELGDGSFLISEESEKLNRAN